MFTEEELYGLLEEAFEAGYDSALDEILDESSEEDSVYDLESEMNAYAESDVLSDEDKKKLGFVKKLAKKHLPKEYRSTALRSFLADKSRKFDKYSKNIEYDDDDMIKNGYKRNPDTSDSNKWIDRRGRKIAGASKEVNPIRDRYDARMQKMMSKYPKETSKFMSKLMEKAAKKGLPIFKK